MKTTTYLRLSLLIPFLVWGLCGLFFIIWSALSPNRSETSGASVILEIILWMILFYVVGILGWFLPYLFLSLILLAWSFRSRAEVLMKVFALSPVAMAMLIMIFVWVLSIGGADGNTLSSIPGTTIEGFLGSYGWFAILALVWGYICVGVGFGIYKLFRHRRIIRDEGNHIELVPGSIP
jgi:hypothetical protein